MRLVRQVGFRSLMVGDFVIVLSLMFLSMVARFGLDWPSSVVSFSLSFFVSSVVMLGAFYFGGLYEISATIARPPLFSRVFTLSLTAGGVIALINVASGGLLQVLDTSTVTRLPFPFINLAIVILTAPLFITLSHRLTEAGRRRRQGKPDVFVVGEVEEVRLFEDSLDDAPQSFSLAHTVTDLAALKDSLDLTQPAAILMLTPHLIDREFEDLVFQLSDKNVEVLVRVTSREALYGLSRIVTVAGLPFVHLRSTALTQSRSQLKRLLDLTYLVLSALVWAPVFFLLVAYQKVSVGSPIFYQQERIGLADKAFFMLKFRTMGVDAEAESGPMLSDREDPRVLPSGKWLRATRLDELPQLINIFRGEMSIVGPRPERPEMTEGFVQTVAGYQHRHRIRPGLTGLAQIHGRYRTSAQHKLGYDLHYATNWSPILDLQILLQTIWVVLARRV